MGSSIGACFYSGPQAGRSKGPSRTHAIRVVFACSSADCAVRRCGAGSPYPASSGETAGSGDPVLPPTALPRLRHLPSLSRRLHPLLGSALFVVLGATRAFSDAGPEPAGPTVAALVA